MLLDKGRLVVVQDGPHSSRSSKLRRDAREAKLGRTQTTDKLRAGRRASGRSRSMVVNADSTRPRSRSPRRGSRARRRAATATAATR